MLSTCVSPVEHLRRNIYRVTAAGLYELFIYRLVRSTDDVSALIPFLLYYFCAAVSLMFLPRSAFPVCCCSKSMVLFCCVLLCDEGQVEPTSLDESSLLS
ncbi:hypothetical protein AMECASPLE_037946 [Ameca splendens]|uniref:Uncharacterized protein n=1 Tax=Ameca splendens TaxID=208324 RepID=A0ABV0XXA1_9TELE